MEVESVNQNGRELFVRTFANVRHKPPPPPNGDFSGDGTVAESRRGARYGYLIRRQHRRAEQASVRRHGQRVERVSVHIDPPKIPREKVSPAEPSNRGGAASAPAGLMLGQGGETQQPHLVTMRLEARVPKTDVSLTMRLSCCREDHWLDRVRTL
jgi:hypothetical protein